MAAEETTITILKWVFIVFVAGFIGYFGKYLSKIILGKVHKKGLHGKKEEPKSKADSKYGYKLEKKKLKAEKKKQKEAKKKSR